MKKYQILFIILALGVSFFWFQKNEDSDVVRPQKTASVSKKIQNNTSKKFSKKDLLHKSRRPAQVRRQIDPSKDDFFRLRSSEERKRPVKPRPESLSQTEIQNSMQKGYTFLNKTRAFKLSSEIKAQYPNGFTHLGFWVAADESFTPDSELGLDVVYNENHGTYGVITGILTVEFTDTRDESEFQVTTSASVYKRYDHISTVLFKYQQKDALLFAQKECELNTRLKICEIEILEHGRFAR